MSDSKYPTDEPFDPLDRGQASDREDDSTRPLSGRISDQPDDSQNSATSDREGGSVDKIIDLDVSPDDEFRQPIEMYPRRNEEEPESASTPLPSDIKENVEKDSTITPLSKEEFAFEQRPHIRKTGDPLYVDPEEAFNNASGLTVDSDEEDPLPARRKRFRPPSDGRRFGTSATAGKTRATARPAMTLVSNKPSSARSTTESSVARDRLKADEIQHESERTRADIVALKLQNQHFGLDRRLADAGMVRGLQPPEAPPRANVQPDDSLSDFESPVPSVNRGSNPLDEAVSKTAPEPTQDSGAVVDHWDEDHPDSQPEAPAPYIPEMVPEPAPPPYPLPNFRPGANTGSVSPIHGSGMRGDIHVDFSKGGIRFGTDGTDSVEQIGFDESNSPVADGESEFVQPEQELAPPLPDVGQPGESAYESVDYDSDSVAETGAGFYPPAAGSPAQAAAGQADIDEQFAYFEQTAAQEHGADFEAEHYIDDDELEYSEEHDLDDDRRGVAQKSVFEIDAPPDNEPLRVEPTTPASFKTMRNLVSERVHRHARNRRSDEQELERQVSGYRLKRSVRRVALGLTVAIALIIGVAFLALDEPNVSREPSIRDILKDLPPMNPSEADGIAQSDSETVSEQPQQRNSTVIIEPDAVDNQAAVESETLPAADTVEQAPAVAEQAMDAPANPTSDQPELAVSAQPVDSAEIESAESAPAPAPAAESSQGTVEDSALARSEQQQPESSLSTDAVVTNAIDDDVLEGSAVPPVGSEPDARADNIASTPQQTDSPDSTDEKPANGIEITTTTLTPAAATPEPVAADASGSADTTPDADQPLEAQQVAAVMLPESEVSDRSTAAGTATAPAASSADSDTDETLQNSIDARMDVAWDQITSLRLTTPVGDNAFETVSNVLDSDPENEEALSALSEIRNRYLQWAERAVDEGELEKAITNYEKVILVNPKDNGSITPVIAQLRKQVQAVELTAAVNERAQAQFDPQQDQQRTPVVVSSVESSRMSRARDELAELDIEVTIRNLVELTNEGDYDAVKLLLESGLSVDSRAGQYGFSPLIVTAIRGDTGMLKLLLENDVDIDGRSSDGRTALMAAAWNGHQFIVDTLLDNKASVQIANADGWTALHYAAWQGHLDIVKTLLDSGADPNVRNDDGWTVAETAEKKGFIQILEIIEGRGQG